MALRGHRPAGEARDAQGALALRPSVGRGKRPNNAWLKTIVDRNLRHHAATKWFHEELGEPWEVVAQYLGDKLTTVLNHYVRAGEDALRDSLSRLANL